MLRGRDDRKLRLLADKEEEEEEEEEKDGDNYYYSGRGSAHSSWFRIKREKRDEDNNDDSSLLPASSKVRHCIISRNTIAVVVALLALLAICSNKTFRRFVNRNKYKVRMGSSSNNKTPFYAIPKKSTPNTELLHGAVGDVLLESTLQRQGARYGTYANAWNDVTQYLEYPDIMYANFEGVASYAMTTPNYFYNEDGSLNWTLTDVDYGEQDFEYGESDPSIFYSGGKFLQFNYHPMLATDLANSGIDVVSTANNHCLDRGTIGINGTIEALENAGVAHTGTRPDPSEDWHAMVNVTTTRVGDDDWKIAYVACTDSTNWSHNHRDREKDLVLSCYAERYIELIRLLAADPDVHAVVAVVHWGGPLPDDEEGQYAKDKGYGDMGWGARGVVYQRQPDCAMRHFAMELAEAGAVAILGVHPHVLHGWEKLVTSFGRSVLVTYSLGNFVGHGGYEATKPPPYLWGRGYDSDVGFTYRRTAVILQFGLQWNKRQNWAEVSCLSYIPIWRSLVDIGYVEDTLTEQGLTTYEVNVEIPSSESEERQFIADRFGPLRRYAEGGGTYNGQDWEAPMDSATGNYDSSTCYPFSAAPETKVDHRLHSGVVHENDGGDKSYTVASGLCAKCEEQYDDRHGCRWCQYHINSYCKGEESVKIDLGSELAWDDCLALVSEHSSCSNVAYAGGGNGTCVCMQQGQRCNLAHSKKSLVVYERQCGRWPRKKPL